VSDLLLRVTGKHLELTNSTNIIAGEVNATNCVFTFNTDWDGCTKTVVFYSDPTHKKYVVLTSNACPIPWDALLTTGTLQIGLFGVKSDMLIPTNYVEHQINEGAHSEYAPPPTEDVYLQIVNIMVQQGVDAQTATDKADEAATSASEAELSEAYAYNSELNAKASETASKASENVVKAIETSLSGTVEDVTQTANQSKEVADTCFAQLAQITTKVNKQVKTNLTLSGNLKIIRNLYETATMLRKLDSTTELRVAFGIDGTKNINLLPNFKEAVTLANSTEKPSSSWTTSGTIQFYHYGTDWIGPYMVRALQNADGDRVANGGAFTGGFHGYNGNIGTTTGGATARNILYNIYVDNHLLADGKNMYGNNITIEFTNRVQGWNTKKADGTGREILEEKFTVEFIDDLIFITCDITALEDIEIQTYYGLQAATNAPTDATSTAWFINGTNPPHAYDYSVIAGSDVSSGNKSTGALCSDVIFNRTIGDLKMHMFINDKIGLGKREYVSSNDTPFFYVASVGKIYAGLIKGTPLTLVSGQKTSWQGGYRFYR
jgi:hypothetical protein